MFPSRWNYQRIRATHSNLVRFSKAASGHARSRPTITRHFDQIPSRCGANKWRRVFTHAIVYCRTSLGLHRVFVSRHARNFGSRLWFFYAKFQNVSSRGLADIRHADTATSLSWKIGSIDCPGTSFFHERCLSRHSSLFVERHAEQDPNGVGNCESKLFWCCCGVHLVTTCMMYLTFRSSFHIRRTKPIEWTNWSIRIMPPLFSYQMASWHRQ